MFTFLLTPLAFSQQSEKTQKSDSGGKVSLDVKNMDIIDVLKILSDQGAFNISIGENVRGRVTLFLKDIDVWDALEIVLVSAGLAYEKIGNVIYIMADRDYELKYGEKYRDKRKMQIFNLKYASASRAKEFLAQVASNIGKIIMDEPSNTVVVIDTPERIANMDTMIKKIDKPLETKIFNINYLSVEDISKKIAEMVTKNVGVVKADTTANKILVTDYPDKIQEIEKLVQAFDEKPLQVLIDAKIVEIKPSEKFYSGIDWDYWIEKYFRLKGSFSLPSTGTNDKLSMGAIVVKDATEQGQHLATMDFLKIFGDTKILSTPRILALNNQEAKILVGTKEAYITTTTTSIGDSPVDSQAVNFVDVGVKLYVTPTVNRKGYITLKIKPEISSAKTTDIKSNDKTTQVPIVTTTEAETSVMVKNGVSVIIGGLKKITREKERKQIPILGDIPFLGAPFRNNKDEWTKNEVVILLTPYIISGDKPLEEELRENMKDIGEREIIDKFEDEIDIERKKGKKDKLKKSSKKTDQTESEFVKPEVKKDEGENINQNQADESKVDKGADVSQKEDYPQEVLAKSEEKDKQTDKVNVEEDLKKQAVQADIKPKDIPRKDENAEVSVLSEAKEEAKQLSGKQENVNMEEPKSYYLLVWEKINNTASYYKKNIKEKGLVKVQFAVSKEGKLIGEPMIVSPSANVYLSNLAAEIVKESLPFPPFPLSKGLEEETLEISLVF